MEARSIAAARFNLSTIHACAHGVVAWSASESLQRLLTARTCERTKQTTILTRSRQIRLQHAPPDATSATGAGLAFRLSERLARSRSNV
jgi:hypothetical protein